MFKARAALDLRLSSYSLIPNNHIPPKSDCAAVGPVLWTAPVFHFFIQSPHSRLLLVFCCCGFGTQVSSRVACLFVLAETRSAMEFRRQDGVAHPTTCGVIIPTRCCCSREKGEITETQNEHTVRQDKKPRKNSPMRRHRCLSRDIRLYVLISFILVTLCLTEINTGGGGQLEDDFAGP